MFHVFYLKQTTTLINASLPVAKQPQLPNENGYHAQALGFSP